MPAPPSRSKPALPAPELAGTTPRSESQTRRVPPRATPPGAPPPAAPQAPRPPQESDLDVDVELEEPAASVRAAPAPAPAPAPAFAARPPPAPPPAVARPGAAAPAAPAPGVPRPAAAAAPPASPGERPSKPSTPLAPTFGEHPSKPSTPLAPTFGEHPSKPSTPLAPTFGEHPSRPSTPLAPTFGEHPSRPSAQLAPTFGEHPSRPSAQLVPSFGEHPSRPSAPLGGVMEKSSSPGMPLAGLVGGGPERISAPPPGGEAGERVSWPGEQRLSSPVPLPGLYLDEPGPGSVLAGRYRLDQVIGRGGMGSVWLARDMKLDIDVALKLIRRDRAAPEARGRLLQEARAAARIGHPSIVRVFDFGETGAGDPYIVMEVLNGEPLSGVLSRKQRLAPNVAVSTLLPVASALVAAHAKGIVHRDLKPDNILLVTNEAGAPVPKLLDFGIARLLDSDTERRFTLAGEVLGSPDYMSPEQAKGEVDVGASTDIWAFSVMLYETITGRRPFHGQNYNALILAIITQEPTPAPDLAAGDPELWGILQRGLAKSVADRWHSMRDLGAALAAWALERGVHEDVAGTSLGSHWLPGGRQRTLSVHPSASMRSPAMPGASPAPPDGAAGVALPRPPRMPAVGVETETRPPFMPNRRRWVVALAAVALSAMALIAYLATRPGDAAESAAAPSASAAAPAPPPPATAEAPTATPTAAASAPPAARPSPQPIHTSRSAGSPARSTKATAPPAPKKIDF